MWKVHLTPLYVCLPNFSSKKVLWRVPPTFVSQSCLFFPLASKKVLWVLCTVPPTFLYICLPAFSSKKDLWKVPPIFFAFVSQSSLVMWKVHLTPLYVCLPNFSSKKVLWRVPPTFVSQSCLFFPLASKKVLWVLCTVPPTFLYICLPAFSSKKDLWKVPPIFFAFVSQSSLVMWKVHLTPLYVCLPNFSSKKVLWKVPPTFVSQSCLFFWDLGANSAGLEKGSLGSVEGSPSSSVHLSPNFVFETGSVEGSPKFFPNRVNFGVFSHSKGVLCSKWLSPSKRFFGVFPKQFFTFVSQSPAVFWANG